MKKIKVCFVAYNPNYSGAARTLWQLFRYIDTTRFECSVISYYYHRGIERLTPYAACYYFPPKKYRFRYSYRLRRVLSLAFEKHWYRRVLKKIDPDIVYFNTNANVEYMQWVKPTRATVVCHIHGFGQGLLYRSMTEKGTTPPSAEWIAATRSVPDYFITCSQGSKQILVEQFGIAPQRITPIRSAIDLAEVTAVAPQLTKEAMNWQGKLVVGAVGAFSYLKGADLLIEAARRIIDSHHGPDEILFTWLGGDAGASDRESVYKSPFATRCQHQIEQYGLQDHFALLGQQASVYPYLNLFDVFVLPSRDECLGIATLEAMALRKPVVVTAVGGVPEVVNSANGILVPAENAEALAQGILAAIANIRSGNVSRVEQAYADVKRLDAKEQAAHIMKCLRQILNEE